MTPRLGLTGFSAGLGAGLGIFLAIAAASEGALPAVEARHASWTELLQAHVDPAGRVDYAGFARDRPRLEGYLAGLAARSPDSHPGDFPTVRHALAYWLNAYNALVIRGVLDRGVDTPSVWGDGLLGIGFFTAPRGTLGGKSVTLKRLEDDAIREPFADPRIHAALNCASVSCPRLPREAFEGETLDTVLDAAMREFVADPRNVAIDLGAGTVTVSKIFDWFEDDFTDFDKAQGATRPSVVGYINHYRLADARLPPSLRVVFRRYDKGLNRQ